MAGLVFRGATVVDGTGAPGYRADVSVHDGRIAAIGPDADGTREIDAAGLVLAPGFVDMHSHSDLQVLAKPDHLAKVSQGVTLEVYGQDGLSYAPVDDATLESLRQQLAGWNDDPPGFDWDWRGVGEYLDRLDKGVAVNAAYLLPQGTIRMLVVGWEADGVLGMLLAVPFAASLRAAWECSGGSHIGREMLRFLEPAVSEIKSEE